MHVRIDTDPGFVVAEGDYQVGGFAPDALELDQFIDIVRNFSGILFDQRPANLQDSFCFSAVEAHWKDRCRDLSRRQSHHSFRGFCQCKEAVGRPRGSAVLGAQAQNARDQNLEWTIRRFGYQSDDGGLPFRRFAAQNTDCCVNFGIFHESSFSFANWLN